MKRALTLVPVLVVAAIVAACAVDGHRDEPKGAMLSHTYPSPSHGQVLPSWHPPVPGWVAVLPEGHPPVARVPTLPHWHPPVVQMPPLREGHPPVPGWQGPVPEGHPACPALGNESERGASAPPAPRPTRLEVIRT